MSWQCAACSQVNPPATKFCGHCGARATDDVAQTFAASMAELAELLPGAGRGADERPDELRLVTALFADISGFTALADQLDPERLIEVIDPVIAKMGEIVLRFGGHVGKYAGDAILAFFGAPIAHEDDAVRALLAAGQIRQEVMALVPTLAPIARHLTLHMGVNTGHVVTGFRGGQTHLDYSLLGDAVNVAQRLEAASAGGEIYVGHSTYLLARDALAFDDVGLLSVKGKPEPIQAWRLVTERPVAAGVGSGAEHGVAPIVGRADEVSSLRRVVESTASGGRLVGIIGEPGVGKTRLLQAAREHAAGAGVRWVQARCLSYGSSLAYWPYIELLRELTGARVDDPPAIAAQRVTAAAADAGAADDAPYLLQIMGVGNADGIAQEVLDNPEMLRIRVQEAVVGFVSAISSESATVLAIEDLHWSDSASLELTRALIQRCADKPFSLIVSTRPDGRAALDSLSRARLHEPLHFELSRLDRPAVATIVTGILGGPPGERLIEFIASRTQGNPLFIQELTRSLLESGGLVPTSSGWERDPTQADAPVPTSIESVLAARIDLLPRDAAELLQIASVVGRDVQLALVRGMTSLDSEKVDAIVDVLVDRGFLHHVDDDTEQRVVFHHPLVVDVAYGRLLRRRRRDLHRRLVEVGIKLYGDGDDVIDLLAHHAYAAEMGVPAIAFLARAARRAAELFANREAITHFRHAIEVAESAGVDATSADERADLLRQLAGLEHLTGDYERALQHYRQVRAATDDLDAYVRMAATLSKMGRYEECLAAIAEAERSHPDLEPAQRAALAVQQAVALGPTASMSNAVAVLAGALVAVEGSGLPIEAELLLNLSVSEMRIAEYAHSLEHGTRAVALLEAHGNLPRLATALRVLGGATADADEGREQQAKAAAILERALALARRVGNAEDEAAALTNLGRVLMELGRTEEAMQCDRDAIEAFAGIGIKAGVACAYVNLSDKLFTLGRHDEAEVAATNGLAAADEIHHTLWAADATAALGRIDLVRGNHARAIERLDTAIAAFDELGMQEKVDWVRGLSDEAHQKRDASRD
jgi:adenylate cyclase